MNILACVKQIVDSTVPLEIDTRTNDVCGDAVAWMANPADLAAVALASSIRDRVGEGQVIALSIGPERADAVLRKSIALGADRGVRLDPPAAHSLDAGAVVALLAAAARHHACALVVCGQQAADTLNGQTGIALSAALDWPIVSSVTDVVRVESGRTLVLRRRAEASRCHVVQVDVPAVLTCEPASAELDYPSLPSLMKSLAAVITLLTAADIGARTANLSHRARLTTVGVSPPKPRPKKVFAPDSGASAAERIRQILSGGLVQRQSDFLAGPPREVAAALVRQLRQRGVI
jgi:electron transfer flavoprotein beta subunit